MLNSTINGLEDGSLKLRSVADMVFDPADTELPIDQAPVQFAVWDKADRESHDALPANVLPLEAFDFSGIEIEDSPWFLLSISRFESGRVQAFLLDCAEDAVAEVTNPEVLKTVGIMAVVERVARVMVAFQTLGLSACCVFDQRRRLFREANDKLVAQRQEMGPDAPAESVAAWEADAAKALMPSLLRDFSEFGVRESMVWQKRRLVFELCGVSAEEASAFLDDQYVWFWRNLDLDSAWSEDASPDFDGPSLVDKWFGIDPIVRRVLDALSSQLHEDEDETSEPPVPR